jgi:hypothetical protein
MSISRRRVIKRTFALACAAGLLVPLVGAADPATEARYPFDPACPWGRVANGKGMITRCLSEAEAKNLVAPRPAPAKPPVAATPTPATPAAASAPVAPGTATPAPAAPPTVATPPAEAPAPVAKTVRVEVGPILPEEGELALGALHKPLDKYRECVEQNGGLSGKSGEVQVHFLVRGERSRAEGVEVTKVKGVSQAAASCIADVVDRRRTGTPTVPMVGATLVFKISS